jgi:hypothetical protein
MIRRRSRKPTNACELNWSHPYPREKGWYKSVAENASVDNDGPVP